jgi:TRAP-type C4-dicarboxylate transport system substrate-binding protein
MVAPICARFGALGDRREQQGGEDVTRRSWAWRLAAVIAAGALALGLVACGDDDDEGDAGDTAGGGAATALDVAYVTTQQHPYGIAIDAFVEEVNGTGELTLSGQPAYPQSEIQLLADVRSGVVPMATISSAIWDTADITAFQALQAPFLITNYPLALEVEGGEIGKAMIEQANQQAGDLVALAIHEGGLRKPFGKEPLASVADFQGKTIRAPQSQVLSEGFRAIGANVEPLPLPEVYQALQNGTVDGVEANLPLIYTQKWYEQAKNVTGNINFWPFPTVLAINKATWDGLSESQQQALTDAAANITKTSVDIFTAPGSTVAQDLVNCGIKYITATPADIEGLTSAAEGAITKLAPESQEFVTQIQAVKDAAPPPAAPPPLPTTKTGECVPPAG